MRLVINNTDSNGFPRRQATDNSSTPPADVLVITSDGRSIPAHSCVLGSASPVLERMLDRPRRSRRPGREIHILGVPYGAVLAFLHFLYSSKTVLLTRGGEEAIAEHGVHLLALSHAHRVGWLKDASEAAVAARLTAERVVDAIKLAKLCDAPRLYQKCMRLAIKDFAAVRDSDGWRFLRRHDPALELEILQFVEEVDQTKKRWKRERAAQGAYQQLSQAMECMDHIFTKSCTQSEPNSNCTNSRTCHGLQQLTRHFSTCTKKVSLAGCQHCKQMGQLFRLYYFMCDHPKPCKGQLCNQFKIEIQMEGKVNKTWRLLAKKVITAKVMSSLARRKRPEYIAKLRSSYRRMR